MKDLGDKVPEEKRKQVEEAIKAVREAIEKNDTDAMKRTYDDLQNKFQEVSADLYKQAAASAGPGPGPDAGGGPARKLIRRTKVPGKTRAMSSMPSSKSSMKTRRSRLRKQ